MAQIQVRDKNGHPVPRVNIRYAQGSGTTDDAIFDVFTDLEGNTGWPIPFWPVGDYTLHVNKANVLPQFGEVAFFIERDAYDRDHVITLQKRQADPIPQPDPVEDPTTPTSPLRGVLRADHRAVRDDIGRRQLLGTTLFWAMQGFRTERQRVIEHFEWMAEEQIDYARILTEVDWPGRGIDPAAGDHEQVLGDVIDTAASKGVRIQPTLVGGTQANHILVADRFANVAKTRAEKIAYVEMVNEWENDGKATMNQLKAMARLLRARGITNLLALSEPRRMTAAERKAEKYTGIDEMLLHMVEVGANVFVDHTDRGASDHGWRMVRQAYDFKNSGIFPASNQEPPGPASSVNSLTDARKLALMAYLSWICGCGFYTLHCGSGVTGLDDPARGRQANLRDVPGIHTILQAIRTARGYVPEDVSGWRVVNNGGSSSPHPLRLDPAIGKGFWEGDVDGSVNKNYMVLAPDNRRFVGVLLGVKGFGSAETRDVLCGVASRAMVVTAVDPLTRDAFVRTLSVGDEWVLPGRKDTEAGYCVVGEFT